MVSDFEELEQMDASETNAKTLNAKEVLTPMSGEKFFPNRRWNGKTLWRRSGSESIHHDAGSPRPRGNLQGGSDGSSSTPLRDSSPDDGDAGNDFWSISGNFIYRHYVETRVKLYVLREESFPVPLKYTDVTRTAHTSLDVMLEKDSDDCWKVDGDRELSDTWTGFKVFTVLN